MKNIKHWNAKFLANRLKQIWYEKRNPHMPWLTKDMNALLDSWLLSTDRGIEWGSGRSTSWFASRVAHLVSVEHDPVWAAKVKVMLKDKGIDSKVDYYDSPIVIKGKYIDATTRYGTLAEDYVNVVKNCSDDSLDFALVDGVERDRCALSSINKLKSGGIIIVDNIQWYLPNMIQSTALCSRTSEDGFSTEVWKEFWMAVKEWRCVWTTDGVSDTAFWVKP